MTPLLRTDGLTKKYGQVLALDHLCLEVGEGEVVGFLGPNGAGKTTTIRLLLDLIRPTSGSASIGGFDCQRQSLQARRLVGYLPGEMPVYPEMSGRGYLAYLARLAADAPSVAGVERLLDRFEIGPAQLDRPIRDLSHGTKRKIGIVQALMGEPRIAILDEPTSGLDPLMIEAFAEVVNDLRRGGRTAVFLSSHVLSEVEETCDRVAVVRDGRLMAVRTIAELSASLPRRVTVRFAPNILVGQASVLAQDPKTLVGQASVLAQDPKTLVGQASVLAQDPKTLVGQASVLAQDPKTLVGQASVLAQDPKTLVGQASVLAQDPKTLVGQASVLAQDIGHGGFAGPVPPLPGIRVVSADASAWVLDVTGPLGPLVERLAGLSVADMDVRSPSLEDYVLGLYRSES